MKINIFSILIIGSLLLSGCGDKEMDGSAVYVEKTSTLLTTTDMKSITINKVGQKVTSPETEGKVLLIDFWATWCPPCKATIPHLVDLQKKYSDKLAVVGVVLEENKDVNELNAFANKFSINYAIANSNANFQLAEQFGGIRSIPTMFLYSPKGKLINMYQGAVPEEMIESDIQRALAE